mgnify:CR=1 FL=1
MTSRNPHKDDPSHRSGAAWVMVSDAIRERLLRDPLPIQLGSLAADLARVVSFAEDPADSQAVASVLEEGKYFAEWIAPNAPFETQVMLADIQRSLVRWERAWRRGEPVPAMRQEAAQQSNELLALTGLM